MKKLVLTEDQIKKYNLVTFKVFDCRVYMQKQNDVVMSANMSRATWQVFLETKPKSDVYMSLLFDECYDIKNPRTGAPNKSKKGNPYIGFLYCPKSWPKDRQALEDWKQASTYRYPRLQDCLRLMTGIFTDCEVPVDRIADGSVKYDDLVDYVKAWEKKTIVGHPYTAYQSNVSMTLSSLGEEVSDDTSNMFSMFDEELPFGD